MVEIYRCAYGLFIKRKKNQLEQVQICSKLEIILTFSRKCFFYRIFTLPNFTLYRATGQPICTVDSNNESTSAAVFQKTTQRCHVNKYVGILADAYTRCRNKFRQMRWQIQMQKFAVMRLRMQNSTKVCAAKLTYRDTCTFRSWLYCSSSRLFVVAVVVVVVGQNLPTIRTS